MTQTDLERQWGHAVETEDYPMAAEAELSSALENLADEYRAGTFSATTVESKITELAEAAETKGLDLATIVATIRKYIDL